ncbi:MAG TPA: RICIN domain-containing protein [Actinophytocola sp.]|uniref:RICIN domain-containing protein n=1 Tax=Actinophytocola sp. TaxID=1872138 RepID=UPI002DBEC7E4|nr:RICIN domain-containing protein [Actinophytocola sp.]HEU5472615.1 RICIN domain-containing protein [Actinophytocola sp.]
MPAVKTPDPVIAKVSDARMDEAPEGFDLVQEFLHRFGYLTDDSTVQGAASLGAKTAEAKISGVLDADTSTALSRYQDFHSLPATGIFDAATRDMMSRSRCLLPDPQTTAPLAFATTCAWDRTALTFAFDAGTDEVAGDDERQAVRNAFITWSAAAPLAFREVAPHENPDVLIRWGNAACGDTDMTGTPLAHADFPPGCGILGNALPRPVHFDDQEHAWVIGPVSGCFDVETIALHEIGHILGLRHSNVAGAVMFPTVSANSTLRVLTADDLEAIRKLYPPTGPLFVKHSGKCLDIEAISMDGGADAIQWDYWGGGNQLFRVEWVEAAHYRLIALHSNKVLDIEAISPDNGAQVIQWDWWGGDNQRFRLDPVGHGYYRIVAKHSGRVLDVSGISHNGGAKVIQWDWWGGDNQRWRLGPAPITSLHSGKVVDVSGISLAAGAPVIQWEYWGGGNQRLRLDPVGDGYYRIMVEHSGMCLDVEAISTTEGARVIQWPYWGGDNQKWRPENVGDGYLKLVAKHSGLCLDVSGISADNGAQLIQWGYWGGNNQKWRL